MYIVGELINASRKLVKQAILDKDVIDPQTYVKSANSSWNN